MKHKLNSMLKRLPKRKHLLLIALGVVVSIVIWNLVSQNKTKILLLLHPERRLPLLAEEIFNQCKNLKYRQPCYEKKIPELMDPPVSLSMQQAFEVTSLVQQLDPKYAYCHVTGHHLSQKEVRKDPSRYKEVITKCPAEGCANGCIHGVFMEKFNAEYLNEEQLAGLTEEVKNVCEANQYWTPTNTESTGCYHALGHAVMYVTQADVDRSIKFCQDLDDQKRMKSTFNCYQGLFMQIFQPLEEEDKQLVAKIKPTNQESAIEFCKKYSSTTQIACLNQSWPLFFSQFKEPDGLAHYCQNFDRPNQRQCHVTAINILTSNLNLDVDFMLQYCSRIKVPSPGECLGISASRMYEISLNNEAKAISLCEKGSSVDKSGVCFERLIQMSQSVLANPKEQMPLFCSHLPRIWQDYCFNRQ